MRTPEAESLVGPGRLTRLSYDGRGDRRALIKLAVECERFSPAIAIEEVDTPETLLLDVTGLAPLWGPTRQEGEQRLADAVANWLSRKNLAGVIAVGSTPGAAMAAARYGSWLQKAAAVTSIVVENDDPAWDRLPIEALRLDGETVEALRGLGVDTVGLLRGLPRESLPARFGHSLVRRLDQFTGDAAEPLTSIRDAPPLRVSWPYETPVTSSETLSRTVSSLLERLSVEMIRRRRGALRVLILYGLDSPNCETERICLRLFRPTASAKELKELAELHGSTLHFRSAVRSVTVLVGVTAPLESRQRSLFENETREDPHETALLINRLTSRVGFEGVSRVERRKSVDPERSFALVSAADNRPRRFSPTAEQAERLRRLPLTMNGAKGEPIQVATTTGGAPTLVRLQGERRVIRTWGPERVETGWWRGRGIRRDAYWVELEDGARLWLTHDLRNRVWRLAGEFA